MNNKSHYVRRIHSLGYRDELPNCQEASFSPARTVSVEEAKLGAMLGSGAIRARVTRVVRVLKSVRTRPIKR